MMSSSTCLRFSIAEMERATNEFASENIIEDGEIGKVYRGNISGSSSYSGDIAVKRMANDLLDVTFQLQKEIQVLTAVNHVNIVSPVGYCDEEDVKMVVYEFMPNGSLHDYIYKHRDGIPTPRLTVKQRLEICLGVAEGLTYLHSRSEWNVIDYDLITENILLDVSLVPRISGFRFFRNHSARTSFSQQIRNNVVQGNYAPECYEANYKPSHKADVYAFGVVLLEVLCERQASNRLLVLGLPYVIKGELPEFTPEHVKKNISPHCARACEKLIRDCLEFHPDERPDMKQVVHKLKLSMKNQDDTEEQQNIRFQANNEQASHVNDQRFSLSDIRDATGDFSTELGKGAFGNVYRGKISKDRKKVDVAVKRMTKNPEQGIPEFEQEMKLFVECDHANIISLVGYCDEGDERILVYEFMPKGSLYDYLHNNKGNIPRLTVEQRLEICLGVAKGLAYLHSREDFNVIHSDLKTENILLDGKLLPKISDFGLSRIRAVSPSISLRVTQTTRGTEGYIAPECYESGYNPSRKADVYAFGVILLEVLCEKPAWERLVIWAHPFLFNGELPKLIPEYVEKNISPECTRECAKLIKDCLEINPSNRPSMSHVTTHLELALTMQRVNANSKRQKKESHAKSSKRFSFKKIEVATRKFGHRIDNAQRVYHGKLSVDVAVKRWSGSNQERNLFQNEKGMLSECHHDNIISLEGYCDEPDEMILMYEFMPNGSLHDHLHAKQHITPWKLDQRLEICLGVAKGLSFLHSINIIHNSLNSKNILLDDNLAAKITRFDFSTKGVGRIFTDQQIIDRTKGMEGYLAPECDEPNYKESQQADVYAFGVVFLEVLCEKKAKTNLVQMAISSIFDGELPKFTPKYEGTSSDCSRACVALIRDCLENDPDKRPSMNQVVNKLEIAAEQQMHNGSNYLSRFSLLLFIFILLLFFQWYFF